MRIYRLAWCVRRRAGVLALAAVMLLALAVAPACKSAAPGAQRDAPTASVTPSSSAPAVPAAVWKPIFRGIELTDITLAAPRPMQLHALRIDLREPGIRFTISVPRTPASMPAPLSGTSAIATGASATATAPATHEVLSAKTTTFLAQTGCQVAINAAPFEPVVDQEGLPQKVYGLALRQGVVYSAPHPTNGVLMLTQDNRATITGPPINTVGQHTGVGGFQMLVTEGRSLGDQSDLHPRTAAGLSKDGRHLILLVIDGRQPTHSEGATSSDTAEWLIRLGAWTGVNLDGGGTTAMAIRGPDGKPALVNRPIHKNIAGNERPAPSHLGVFAMPLN